MLDPRISLKNPWLAGILAFLVPGLGHFYQGRFFKGGIYSVCILGTLVMGMWLGDWSVVFWKQDPTTVLNPYYAQFFVGLPTLPALLQSRRYQARENSEVTELTAPLKSSFTGILKAEDSSVDLPNGKFEGTIALEPHNDPTIGHGIHGTLVGMLTPLKGDPVQRELKLGMAVSIGKSVSADPDREVTADVIAESSSGEGKRIGRISGSIPRTFADRFQAPPDEDYYLSLHRQLGKFYELAVTFTMVAGLLNILAILDAVEGPAYGYGDGRDPTSIAKDNRPSPAIPASGPPSGTTPNPPTEASPQK